MSLISNLKQLVAYVIYLDSGYSKKLYTYPYKAFCGCSTNKV